MGDAAQMRETMMRYLDHIEAGDVDGVLALMADDVEMEDPVGGPPTAVMRGKEAVAAFLRGALVRTGPTPTRTGPIVTTAGSEAAMPFTLALELDGKRLEYDVIDVFRFDDRGLISSLRAFWNVREGRSA